MDTHGRTGITAAAAAAAAGDKAQLETKLHPVYTWGYTKRAPSDLAAVLDAHHAVVLDTRHNPHAAQPGWTLSELEEHFQNRYFHAPGFGNLNYGGARARGQGVEGAEEGVPVLADFHAGFCQLQELRKHTAVVLMCVCRELSKCHRYEIANRLACSGVPTTELNPRGDHALHRSRAKGKLCGPAALQKARSRAKPDIVQNPTPPKTVQLVASAPPKKRRGRGTQWSQSDRHAASRPLSTKTASSQNHADAAWGQPSAERAVAKTQFHERAAERIVKARATGGGKPRPAPKGDGLVSYPFMAPDQLAEITVPASSLKTNPEILRAVLAKNGVAVISDVLSPYECEEMESYWKSDLLELVDTEALTDHHVVAVRALESKHGIEAWPTECNQHIGHAWRGFATHRGLPHGRFAWSCRLHPQVRQAFAAIHDVSPEKLCVGLDNVMWQGFDFPKAETNTEWLHCDQNHNTGLTWPITQGILYVRPSTDDHASTTVIWPQSHTIEYARVMADPAAVDLGRSPRGQLVKLNTLKSPDGKALHRTAVCEARRVPMKAGAMLLWDSRTIHQGWCGGPRLAQPICWEPRERRDEAALRRKMWMCVMGIGSSHSSTEGRVHQMAPKWPMKHLPGSSPEENLRLPLVPSLVPFGIREDKVGAWKGAQRHFWGNRKERNPADKINPEVLRPFLREDVLDNI